MAFREVAVTEIREVLRAWLAGAGLRVALAPRLTEVSTLATAEQVAAQPPA